MYLADDRVLGRRVAIKFLGEAFEDDASARERFLREARAAARLTHPNACSVYEIGEDDGRDFIVMQYVEGETVAERIARQGRMPVPDVVSMTTDAARALAEAHDLSLVHRDIKPHNIMIDRRGYAVVLDFGLAKLTHKQDAGTEASLTGTGAVAGTVPYMAPEQLLGEPLDGRADLFSLGVVMYEALTGRRPFDGPTAAHVITAILGSAPPSLAGELGADGGRLAPIVSRCLARKREDRYAGARELLADLATLVGSGTPLATPTRSASSSNEPTALLPKTGSRTQRRPARRKTIDSLAVLPFETSSARTEADLLSEGLTDSLISALSRLPKLRVMARTTVYRYRGSALSAQEIGAELGVRAILSGRVQAVGDRFVVRAELVDVADGSLAWTEQYARESADIIEMQEEIATEISSTLRPRLTPAQRKRVVTRKTTDSKAYQHYVRGVWLLNRREAESMRKATESFQAAIEADPSFAAPYCGLAEVYVYFGFLEMRAPLEVYPAARAAAMKALELEPGFAEAHAALGWMKVTHEWDWEGAERELAKAARLNPNCAIAHHWHGLLLSFQRRFDEALPKVLLAQKLDPLAPIVNTLVGTIAWHRGDYREALRVFDTVAEMAPGFIPLHLYRGFVLQAVGELDRAAESFAGGLEIVPEEGLLVAALGNCFGSMGRREEAISLLRRLEQRREASYASAYGLAVVCAGLGDREAMYRWLEVAFAERAAWLCTLAVDTRWNAFRAEPRFRELTERMRLPTGA